MACGREEIFGPVLCIKRVDSFEEGLQLMNNNRFANGSVIYTESGHFAREFARRTDGGMVMNDLLMQFQSDILAKPVVRPMVKETTALGAAYAAGLAVGFFQDTDELVANWAVDQRWEPQMDEESRERLYRFWKKAVTRSFDWVEST